MLMYPIFHEQHWFLFVVDIRNKKFIFLDSLYSENDVYHAVVRAKLIPTFKRAWWQCV
ncbi:hypothetical protein ACP4OV_021415 [Aristida adscensionis]